MENTSVDDVAGKENQIENLRKVVLKELEESNGINAITYGNPFLQSGKDFDMQFFYLQKDLPSREKREEIEKHLKATGVDVHLFFVPKEQIEKGRLQNEDEVQPVYHYMTEGFSSQQNLVNHDGADGVFGLYIAGTAENFVTAPGKEPVDLEEGIKNLALSNRDGSGFAHYYMACFLDAFLNKKHEQDEYISQLAKSLIRVRVGKLISELDSKQMDRVKISFLKNIKNRKNRQDRNMLSFIEEMDGETPGNLLETAARIREGQIDGINLKEFIYDAENQLFYDAFQTGIDDRRKEKGGSDSLSEYAFQICLSARNKEILGIEPVEFEDGELIIKKGDKSHLLYFFPQNPYDKETNSVHQNGGFTIILDKEDQIQREAGHITGELGAFLGVQRTADVVARGKLKGFCIDGEKLMRELNRTTTLRNLCTRPDVDQEARMLDVFLRYLAYETIFLMNEIPIKNPKAIESEEILLSGNSLREYFLPPQVLTRVFEVLREENFKVDGQEIVKVVKKSEKEDGFLFKKGDESGGIYFVESGEVYVESGGKRITVKAGAFVGESSLIYKNRSANVSMSADAEIYEIPVDLFNRFVHSRKPIPGTDFLPVQILYHIAAANMGRIRNRV